MLPRSHPAAWCLALLLVAASPPAASAAEGVAISWNGCYGGPGAVQNRSFACDTNVGAEMLHGSFRLASPMAIVIGVEMVVDVAVDAHFPLPQWWELWYEGACRQTSLSMLTFPDPAETACEDWAQAQAVGGIGGYCTYANVIPNGCGIPGPAGIPARIKLSTAVPPASAQDLVAGQDYFAFTLRISHAKTVGTGSCARCDLPLCLVFNSANLVARDNVETRFLSGPAHPGSNAAYWQGGGGGTLEGCLRGTPAQKTTWGAVKSLYR